VLAFRLTEVASCDLVCGSQLGPNGWLMSLIIVGSVDIASSDDKESGSRGGFSWSFFFF